MKLTKAEQQILEKHERMSGLIEKIISDHPGFNEIVLRDSRDFTMVLLVEYGFDQVKDQISDDPFDFYEFARDYQDEIQYVLAEHKRRLNPSWKHLLMSKKISDMTGYEYKTYLELIGKTES